MHNLAHISEIEGTESHAGAFGCVTIVGVGTAEGDAEFDMVELLAVDFDTFFARHHSEMVRALALTLGDAEFGRDAAAEGFAWALQKWSTVSTYPNVSGWVYRVGLNWARSRRRKFRRERIGVLVDGVAPTAAPR